MKKKILTLSLSAILAVGTLFGAVACEKSGMGEGTDGAIQPGTVISDETIRGDLLKMISETEITGISYSGSAGMKLTAGDKSRERKIALEGAVRLGESPEADVFASLESGEGADNALQYYLFFLRGANLYRAEGEEEGESVDFNALKTELKGERPIVLGREETQGIPELVTSPTALRLLRNAGILFDGVVTKTEGGYSLTYDMFSGIDDFLMGAETLLGEIESNVGMTLTAIFSRPFVSDTLSKLLDGITAEELYAFAEKLPGEIATFLPAAEGGTAEDYVKGLLRSGEFYAKVTRGDDAWKDFQTFGEVPIGKLAELISGGELDLGSLGLKDTVHRFRTTLKKGIVTLLLTMFGEQEGELSGENVALTVEFSFDDEKRLLGFALDALAEGNRMGGEQQPDGGKTPEDGQGDPVASAAAEGATHLRATLKLSAACLNSPEMFDLTGCTYRSGDGTETIG